MECISLTNDNGVRNIYSKPLIQGAKARIIHTGQVVDLIRVSYHGISVVAFRTGGEYFMPNRFLEPLLTIH